MNRKLSMVFFSGGVLVIIMIMIVGLLLKTFGNKSDGLGTNRNHGGWIALLFCGYFFLSAFGLRVAKTRLRQWLVAFSVHVWLLIAYVIFFFSVKNHDPDGCDWRSEAARFAFLMLVFFLPWSVAWAIILSAKANALCVSFYRKMMR